MAYSIAKNNIQQIIAMKHYESTNLRCALFEEREKI